MFHKIIISRGPEATQPATQRHFNKLTHCYDQVHCINLLSQKEGEALLSKEYNCRIKELVQEDGRVSYTHFDFYAMCKNGSIESASLLIRDIRHYLDDFGYFVWDQEICAPASIQNGVFRTNCLSW
jgi:synaptojanin